MSSRKLSRREALIAVGMLGGGGICGGAVRAHTPLNTFKPSVAELMPSAFRPVLVASATGADAPVLQAGIVRAAAPFSDMLIRWQPPPTIADRLRLQVRVSGDNRIWTEWQEVAFEAAPHLPDDPLDVFWSEIICVSEARFYQVRVSQAGTGSAGGAPVDLGAIQVHTVDTRMPELPQPNAARSEAVKPKEPTLARPAFVSRTDWGNPHGEDAPNAPPRYSVATHLIVHHTAESNTLRPNEPDWAARVRAIWSFHTYSRGWGDIGYNWLIDPDGVIYAGRAGSTDSTRDAVGFHDAANYGSMGVSVIGTYTDEEPTPAAQESLVSLLAWKAAQRTIDPYGVSSYDGCARSSYCAPHYTDGRVDTIAGHRQITPDRTVCPGDAFMALLPAIKRQVAERLSGATSGEQVVYIPMLER